MSSTYEQKSLQHETSPYLQQHADDPVHWHAWGEQPFAYAKAHQKLILLSIGYLACHWCHVMAKESFHHAGLAQLVNSRFVPILVDREERPDLDQYFMQVCRSLLDGSGGWPLNVLLTPDGVPVFACLYLPRQARGGGPGFFDILQRYSKLWLTAPNQVEQDGQRILTTLAQEAAASQGESLQPEVVQRAVKHLRHDYDEQYGGFGPEPKFITPHRLLFLLNRYRRSGEADLLAMVERTCAAMRRGGVCDHVGGGVHRYSTDIFWFEPHFEKMVYDQAGLILVYAALGGLGNEKFYGHAAEELVNYLAREMTDTNDCFIAAEDADSEGKDGLYFLWRRQEIVDLLGDRAGERFCQVFGVSGQGNFRMAADGQGLNILARKESFAALAETLAASEQALRSEMQGALQKLFFARKKRPAPMKDTLVITAWNGLIISALAHAGQVFNKRGWVTMAERAASFFCNQMDADSGLRHSYVGKTGSINAFASDYFFLAKGLRDLYGATRQSRWLARAVRLVSTGLELFWDKDGGGLLETVDDSFSASYAMKTLEERDLPSVNAVALEMFCWLAIATGDQQWQAYADGLVESLGRRLGPQPELYPSFLQGYSSLVEPIRKVVVAGRRGAADTEALLGAVDSQYTPETVVLLHEVEGNDDIFGELFPFAAAMLPIDGKAAAYICDRVGCYAPITEPEVLARTVSKA